MTQTPAEPTPEATAGKTREEPADPAAKSAASRPAPAKAGQDKHPNGEASSGNEAFAGALCQARRDYHLAAHDAGIVASQVWWRAYAELGATQQRIAADGGLRRYGAYQAWYSSVQATGTDGGAGNASALAYQTYCRVIDEAAKAEQEECEAAQNAYRTALSEANEASAAAAEAALKAYLGRIQAALGHANIAALDGVGLGRLAQEVGYAAQLAQSGTWGQP